MPLEELKPTNNYITYDQLQRLLSEKLLNLEREIEAKLLQLRESKLNFLEEKIDIKVELEALKEQFRLFISEYSKKIETLSFKISQIDSLFIQKLTELNQRFTEINAKLFAEFEKYQREFFELLQKNDLRKFFENNVDLFAYFLSPMTNEVNELKSKLDNLSANISLIQSYYREVNSEIRKQIDEILQNTFNDFNARIVTFADSVKENIQKKISDGSVFTVPNVDSASIESFKNDIVELLNNITSQINELKEAYHNLQSIYPQQGAVQLDESLTQKINDMSLKLDELRDVGVSKPDENLVQMINDINLKLDELRNSRVTSELPFSGSGTEELKSLAVEIQANLNAIRKISEDISQNLNSLSFNPSIASFDFKGIDDKLEVVNKQVEEISTLQFGVQNDVQNLFEKVSAISTDMQNVSKMIKNEMSGTTALLKSEILNELKKQKSEIVTAINSINEPIQSLKGIPAIIIFSSLLVIGAMILLKFVF